MPVQILAPQDEDDTVVGEVIQFTGTANSNVVRVKLSAEGRWPIGQSDVNGIQWSVPYAFTQSGTRQIIAQGLDNSNNPIATDEIWLFVKPIPINDVILSSNFTLRELIVSTAADRLHIDNTPNAQEIENLRQLCLKILQPARDALGPIVISSGFRSEALNQAVGGVPNSDHRLGFAADIIPLNTGTLQLAEWVAKNVPDFDQIILEFGTLQNPNWIHVSANPRGRQQILRATAQGGITTYSPLFLA